MPSPEWAAWLEQVAAEQREERGWEDLWCRTYCVGLYANISEWHRENIRAANPWFRG